MDKDLNVGDVIYFEHYGKLSRGKIDKVTKKYAFCGSTKYYRTYKDEMIHEVKSDIWNTITTYIESDMLKNQYARQRIIQTLKCVDYSKFDYCDLIEINKIVKKYQG